MALPSSNPLPGSDPAAAAARSVRRKLEMKRASREYEKYCASQGMSSAEAKLLAPSNVKAGLALRQVEEKKRQLNAFKAAKAQLKKKFQSGSA